MTSGFANGGNKFKGSVSAIAGKVATNWKNQITANIPMLAGYESQQNQQILEDQQYQLLESQKHGFNLVTEDDMLFERANPELKRPHETEHRRRDKKKTKTPSKRYEELKAQRAAKK